MRTNPLLYLAAFILTLGGWMAGAAIAATAWNDLHGATVTQIQSGTRIAVPVRGVAFFTDLVQDRGVTCHSTPAGALRIDGAKFDLVDDDGIRKWHMLSTTINPKPGSYAVACTPTDKAVDTATYGYAELPTFNNATIGKGIGSIATLAAVILAAWCYWGRRTERILGSLESA